MWTDGEDFSEQGDHVRLYQPILYGQKPASDDLCCSFIGGETTAAATEPPVCASCQDPLRLLLQLFVPQFAAVENQSEPTKRTIQVFACNKAACTNKLFQQGTFSYGGNGVVACRRLTMAPEIPKESQAPKSVVPAKAPTSATTSNGENDWTMDGGEDGAGDNMDDLESKLAAMETNKAQPQQPKKPKAPVTKKPSKNTNVFSCFGLSTLSEPSAVRSEGMDEDDVGFSSGNDAKIQQMLARYMAEEEDEGILAALQGTGSDGGVGNGVRDERLSAQDRALLTYSDRMKRSPRQAVRYALGGCPLWSIPTEESAPPIPPCACGAQRVFEAQLLPSILHVLDVDKYAEKGDGSTTTGLAAAYETGGMNWGNVAIYSCPAACSNEDEYVVVQDSMDERPGPELRRGYEDAEAVVVPEDSKFDDDDDDAEDEGEMECF